MRVLVSLALVGLLAAATRAQEALPKPKGSIGILVSAETGSVVIVEAVAGSPAEKAGLKEGDVIVKVNDLQVKEKEATPEDVTAMVKEVIKHEPGKKIKMTVKRDGKEKEVEVTVGEPGKFVPKKKPKDK